MQAVGRLREPDSAHAPEAYGEAAHFDRAFTAARNFDRAFTVCTNLYRAFTESTTRFGDLNRVSSNIAKGMRR